MSHIDGGRYIQADCREADTVQHFFFRMSDSTLSTPDGDLRIQHPNRDLSADTASKLRGFLASRVHRNGHGASVHDWTDREGSYQLVIDLETRINVSPISTFAGEATYSSAVRPVEQEEEEMERAILQLLEKVYELDRANDKKRSASKAIFTFVERNFARRDLRAVHRLMARMDIGKMSELSLVGLIRATSRAKNFLPLWGRTLQKTRKALEARGVDHRGLLMGIRQVG